MKNLKIAVFFIIIGSIYFFWGCREEYVGHIELTAGESKTFITPLNQNLSYTSRFLETDSGNYLACYYRSPEIIIYDFDSGDSVRTIPLKGYYPHSLLSYYIHNKDSIFLQYSAGYRQNYEHDSTLLLINSLGDILQSYSYEGAPVRYGDYKQERSPVLVSMKGCVTTLPKSMIVSSSRFFDRLHYSDNKVFVNFSACCLPEFAPIAEKHYIPAGGHINIDENRFYAHNVRIPSYGGDNPLYSDDYRGVHGMAISGTGNPVYGFRHTSELLEFDLDKEKVINRRMHSLLIDSIMPMPGDNPEQLKIYGQYQQLYYNPYEKRYYRFFRLPAKEDAPPAVKNEVMYGVIIADDSFNKLGEGLIPAGYTTIQPLFTPEGLWLSTTNSSANELIYTRFEVDITEKSRTLFEDDIYASFGSIESPVESENIAAYFVNFLKANTESSGILLVPLNSCPSCIVWTLDYFNKNHAAFEDNDIHLILAGRTKSIRNQYVQQSGIDTTLSNFHIDADGLYLKYIDSFINPRLTYFREGEILLDTIFNVTTLYNLPLHLKEIENL